MSFDQTRISLFTCAVVNPITRVASTAHTLEASNSVCAISIRVAIVSTFVTLIYVCQERAR